MKRRKDLRTGIAALGILSLIAVGSVSATPTEAAWTEPEYATAVRIDALDLTAKPRITSCTTTTKVVVLVGLVFDSVTIKWVSRAPLDVQRVYFGTKAGSLTPTLVGQSNGEYSYSVTYSEALLGSLLGNLLGSTTAITVKAEAGSWTSPEAKNRLRIELLGLYPRCLDPIG